MTWGQALSWWQYTILAVLSALWEFYAAETAYRLALAVFLLSD